MEEKFNIAKTPVFWEKVESQKEYILKIDNKPIAELTDEKLKKISDAVTEEFKTLLSDVQKKKELKNLLCPIVMLELADEYKAVRDVNLQHIIKIGKVRFRESAEGFDFLDTYFPSST